MALGVFLAARELNVACPDELSIVGFDNLDFAEFTASGADHRAPTRLSAWAQPLRASCWNESMA